MNNFTQALKRKFNYILWTTLFFQISAIASQSSSIDLTDLGKFRTEFTTVEPNQTIEGSKLIGRYVAKPKSGYQVSLPFDVQQSIFIVTNGQEVKKGDEIATINGVDVHHFIDEMTVAKSIYLNSKKHFQATKNSADTGTFKSTQWLEINKRYFEAKLNYEHFVHLEKVIQTSDNDIIAILSPIDGFINLNGLNADTLFEVIPPQSLFVKSYLPTDKIAQLSSLVSGNVDCKLNTASIEPVVKNYQQAIWSKPIQACQFKLGQNILLTPQYATQGFKLSRAAIFELNNQDYVAVKRGNKLHLEKVSIIGKQGEHLIVHASKLSTQAQVLISSVSVAQGLFMGLGE